ncbi:putative Ankyrin-3 [Nannochloris sp. 'desiccata']|nr:putative Ankyrin-3 [Chlorella desiccata (nom. nud.)]
MGQSASKEGRRLSHAIRRQDAQEVFRITATFPEACAVYRTFWKKKTLLMIAAENDNILAVSTILWACEQTLGPSYLTYLNDASSSGNTALILAARHGNEAIIRILLEEGATVLPANRRGQAAVHVAAHGGHSACLELILDAPIRSSLAGGVGGGGARIAAMASVRDYSGESRYIDAHNRAGFTALHLAAITRSSSAVTALVERGATLDTPVLRGMERLPFLCGGSTPLHIAAAQGDAQTCLVLLDGQWRHPGLELRRVRNMLGLTPLNCALLGGHHDILRSLLDSGSRTTRDGRRGGRRGAAAAAANGLADPLGGTAATSLYRMIPLSASFPDSLREHMLAVLQRAALLLQLREIAGEWRLEGAAQPTDTLIVSNLPLLSLNVSQINKLQTLLRRRETSLKDFLYGLESTLRRTGTDGRTRTSSRRSRRTRQREAAEVAAAGAAIPAAAAPDEDVEGAHAESAEIEAAAIAELASSSSSDDDGEEDGRIERQRRNDLELALHEISGIAAGGVSINGTEGAAAGVEDQQQQLSANNQEEGKSPRALLAVVFDEDCSICMDARTEITFLPCAHSLCFQCACRLCARGRDAATCPFCRQPVDSVTALAGARSSLAKGKDESNACAGGVPAAAPAAAAAVS